MLRGTEQAVYDATLACLRAGGDRCFSMAGCEIPDGTPAGNLHAQTRALEDFASFTR
jgi:uroporphyrinogen-III decarboxylase